MTVDGDVGGGFVRPALVRAGGSRFVFGNGKKTLPQRSNNAANDDTIESSIANSEQPSGMVGVGEQSKNPPDKSKLSLHRLDDATILYTNGLDNDFSTATMSTASTSFASIEERQVLPELVSTVVSLRVTNFQHEETIRKLKKKLTKLESRMKSRSSESTVAAEVHSRKEEEKQQHSSLVLEKALHQREKRSSSRPRRGGEGEGNRDHPSPQMDDRTGRRDRQDRSNENEPTETIRRLARGNGLLLAECRQLREVESQRDELLVLVEEMRIENDAINRSMDDAMQLMSGMRQKMAGCAREHEGCVGDCETQVASMKGEIDRAALYMAELNASWSTRLEERKMEEEKLKMENREAYQTCEVLQREIDMLREALEESRAGIKSDNLEDANGYDDDDDDEMAQLRKLKKISWSDDT